MHYLSGMGNIPANVPNGNGVVQRFWSISGAAQQAGHSDPFSRAFYQTVLDYPRNATIDALAAQLGDYSTATRYYVAGMLLGSPVFPHLLATRDRRGRLASDAGVVWDHIRELGRGARALAR